MRWHGLGWVLCAVVVLVLAAGVSARAEPAPDPPEAPPAPTAPAPSPTQTAPTPSPSCQESDCAPEPDDSSSPAPSGEPPKLEDHLDDGDGGLKGITDRIDDVINSAITSFFKGIVTAALNPLLDLLGNTLLTTPTPQQLPRVGELWTNSWHIVLASYSILIMIAGLVLMSHESIQRRHSVKEIVPRIPLAFLTAALSLVLAGKAVSLANALSHAVMSDGVDEGTAGKALRDFIMNPLDESGSIFLILLGIVLAGSIVVLLVTYVVRVALTVILVAGAPLALMCHALPQTDGVARWWWRAFGGVLAIQVGQSLALVVGVRVLLDPDNTSWFAASSDGLVNLIVALALMYILIKIPFWILSATKVGHGRSLVGSVVRGVIFYKTFGLLRGPRTAGRGTGRASARTGNSGGAGGASGTRGAPGGTPPPARQRHPHSGAPAARTRYPTTRRPPGPPLFLAPRSGPSSSGTPSTGRAAGAPPPATFRPPGPLPGSPAPAVPAARPAQPPGPPLFQAPGGPPAPARQTRGLPAPARQPFRQPNPSPSPTPRTATGPPGPPAFRSPAPASSGRPRPARTNPPPPPLFSSPPPRTTQPPSTHAPPTRPRSGGSPR